VNERRHDLDWLRILAFGVLILYHVGMFYVTWDWHVKSSRTSAAIEPLMRLSSPWRLSLLFLISGAATRYLVDTAVSVPAMAMSRLQRLLPPLLLAIFVIVPPQSYYEIVEALRQMPADVAQPWLQDFYLKYVTASGHWCDRDGCLLTPIYNHMWFAAYLLLYTMALVALLPLLRPWLRQPSKWLTRLVEGPGLVVVPWMLMFLLRATLAPRFGQTHYFWNDWYLHPLYFGTFLFGFAVARQDAFFLRCAQLRWTTIGIALCAWATLELNFRLGSGALSPGDPVRLIAVGARELQAWTTILAAIGFAHHHLRNVDTRARRVLTEAIFPFYLIHQTIIVVAGHYLDGWRLPLLVEVPLLIGATAMGCWLFYDLGRRMHWLRPWIGLASNARPRRAMDAGTQIS
jgi:peptidoglycan/LPS O-acetylase OafA/YrhL